MNKPHDEQVQVSVSRLVMIVMIVGDSRGIDLMKIWQGAALNLPLNSFQTLAAFSQYPHQQLVMITVEMMVEAIFVHAWLEHWQKKIKGI